MKKIPLPESQIQEVLFELINRLFISRRIMMLSCGVLNLTAIISELRNKGLNIVSTEIKSINKYGRQVSSVRYSLENKKEAVKFYKNMKENQAVISEHHEK